MFKKVNYDKKEVRNKEPLELKLWRGPIEERPSKLGDHLAITIPRETYYLKSWSMMPGAFDLLNLIKLHFGHEIVSYQEIRKRVASETSRRLKLQLSFLWANGFLIKWVKGVYRNDEQGLWQYKAGRFYGTHYQVPEQRITNWKEWSESLPRSEEVKRL